MKAELKRYQICPECGKEYKDHPEYKKFDIAIKRVKDDIEVNRGMPKEDFKKYLIDKRKFYANEVQSTLIFITSPSNVDQETYPDYWERFIGKDASEESRVQLTLKGGYYKVNLDAYLVLNFNYDCLDIFDSEINKVAEAKEKLKERTFPDYLSGVDKDKRETFAAALREEFKDAHGLGFMSLIEGLKEKGYLIIEYRGNKKLFEASLLFFGQSIGTYNGTFLISGKSLSLQIESAIQRIELVYKSL